MLFDWRKRKNFTRNWRGLRWNVLHLNVYHGVHIEFFYIMTSLLIWACNHFPHNLTYIEVWAYNLTLIHDSIDRILISVMINLWIVRFKTKSSKFNQWLYYILSMFYINHFIINILYVVVSNPTCIAIIINLWPIPKLMHMELKFAKWAQRCQQVYFPTIFWILTLMQ